jgi:hypothetical protein
MLCSLVDDSEEPGFLQLQGKRYSEDGGSSFLHNVGNHTLKYMASHPRSLEAM